MNLFSTAHAKASSPRKPCIAASSSVSLLNLYDSERNCRLVLKLDQPAHVYAQVNLICVM